MATTTSRGADELAAPSALLGTSSAMDVTRRMMPNTSWSRLTLTLAGRPGFDRESVPIAEGRSDVGSRAMMIGVLRGVNS